MGNDNGALRQQSGRAFPVKQNKQGNKEDTKEMYDLVAFPSTASNDSHKTKEAELGQELWLAEEGSQVTPLRELPAANPGQVTATCHKPLATRNI